MSNLEKQMKRVAAALTGKEADTVPDNLEAICSFIAENYQAGEQMVSVSAPADLSTAPTQDDFNGLIAKLKEAKVFQ